MTNAATLCGTIDAAALAAALAARARSQNDSSTLHTVNARSPGAEAGADCLAVPVDSDVKRYLKTPLDSGSVMEAEFRSCGGLPIAA